MKLKLYTDGWSRGNPWQSWLWVYITDETGKEVDQIYKYVWIKTNNEAEYMAMLLGVERCYQLGATEIEAFADSKLVIEQLSGRWKIKKEALQLLNTQIKDVIQTKKWKVTFTWIPREENKMADRLSNVAMDEKKREQKNEKIK